MQYYQSILATNDEEIIPVYFYQGHFIKQQKTTTTAAAVSRRDTHRNFQSYVSYISNAQQINEYLKERIINVELIDRLYLINCQNNVFVNAYDYELFARMENVDKKSLFVYVKFSLPCQYDDGNNWPVLIILIFIFSIYIYISYLWINALCN